MPSENSLIGIAQIACTFAGFAALAGIVGRRPRGSSRYDVERLRTVILVSIMVVVTALIPIVVEAHGVSEASAWRMSSALALVINWAFLGAVVTFGRSSGLHGADRVYTWSGYAIEVPLELALIANAFGILATQAAGFYLTFLYLALMQAVIAFVQLINSLFAGSDDDPP